MVAHSVDDEPLARKRMAARSSPSLTEFLTRLEHRTAYIQQIAMKSKGRVRLIRLDTPVS